MIKHFGKISVILVMLLLITALTGCGNFLENYDVIRTAHIAEPFERPTTESIIVASYDELVETILDFIMDFRPGGLIHYHHYEDEDVYSQVEQAIYEIMNHHPVGAYVVEYITAEPMVVVSYFEIEIEIEYKRTREQLDSIVQVASRRYLTSRLLRSMSTYDEEFVIRTNLQLTEEDIEELVREVYYQNPGRIIMLPVVAVEFYPETGDERIYEIKFGHFESPSIMQRYAADLTTHIYHTAGRIYGDTDAEILLAIVETLLDGAEFDLGTANTISTHGTQNWAATAFGALMRGSAVGEGFAMAFKALSDEFRFDNRIVLGHRDGIVHAWNIVSLYGSFYHIDIAMISIYGLETAFLRTDEDFEEMLYQWDRVYTVRADGELTLDDVLPPDDPYYEEGYDGETDDEE